MTDEATVLAVNRPLGTTPANKLLGVKMRNMLPFAKKVWDTDRSLIIRPPNLLSLLSLCDGFAYIMGLSIEQMLCPPPPF